MKVPKRHPKRGRLWLNDGSCVRLRPMRKDHVWSYDLMTARTDNGRAFRMLNIIDEYTKECLDITVERKIPSHLVIERVAHLFITRGIPEHIRSDNGPEFTAKAVRRWLSRLGVKTLFIEPGSPWENGYIELPRPPKIGPDVEVYSGSNLREAGYEEEGVYPGADHQHA